MVNVSRKELARLGAVICAVSAFLSGGVSTYLIINTGLLNQFANPDMGMVTATLLYLLLLPAVSSAVIFGYATGSIVDRFSFSRPKVITTAITILLGVLLSAPFLYDLPLQVSIFVGILQLAGFVIFLMLALLFLLKGIVSIVSPQTIITRDER